MYKLAQHVHIFVLVLLSSLTSCTFAFSEGQTPSYVGVESVRIGDSKAKIFPLFQSKYQIKENHTTVSVLKDQKIIMNFLVDDHDYIFGIDIYSDYFTEEGIGCGSTLLEAKRAYGPAKVVPTDPGYFIQFERVSGILFLLDNDDIPKVLRNIPDDVFSAEEERSVLATVDAKINRLEITGWGGESIRKVLVKEEALGKPLNK